MPVQIVTHWSHSRSKCERRCLVVMCCLLLGSRKVRLVLTTVLLGLPLMLGQLVSDQYQNDE